MTPSTYTSWAGPARPLLNPSEGPAADVDVRCHVTGCDEEAAWWRPVNPGALGACLCDGHRDAMLVSWSVPPYPPRVEVAEQLALGGEG